MKIMTFNIQHCKNYITGNIEIEAVAEAIKKYGADISGINADIPEIIVSEHRPDYTEIQ